jgi:hypothetical protein
MLSAALAVLVVLVTSGCSHWAVARSQRCNPLAGGIGEDCLLPFPSSFYTRADPSSVTGVKLDLNDAAVPSNLFGTVLDPGPYNQRDGFSNVATLLAQFPARINPNGLPDPEHVKVSLTAASPVQLFREDTGERVPLFAELDGNADPRHDKQALVIQPVVRLRPRTRYIALIRMLKTTEGGTVPPLSGFQRLRDGTVPQSDRLAAWRDRYEEIFAFLAREGVERRSLQLAWDFTTSSDENVVGRLVRMRDVALARLASKPESPSLASRVHVREVEESPTQMPELLRRIRGSFTVPSFLEGGNGERLHVNADGIPAFDREADFPLTIQVPRCAKEAKGPLPVMIYGHGTFNSAENEMGTAYGRSLIERLCMIQVGTDWLGRARPDLVSFITKVLPDWNHFSQITDRLQQAHINQIVLARLIRNGALRGISALRLNGQPLVDEKRLYYYGISEGACQGVTTMALSPDLNRGAMNVPCGFWSMFFWRSSDMHQWALPLRLMYPGALERQKLMVLSQLLWDYTDPANYGGHLLRDYLPGNGAKHILYQEGINDASVPNLTTRAMVRTIGLKLLGPGIESVDGIDEVTTPQESAYVQFDVGSRPKLGLDNVPPAKNGVHEKIRTLPAAEEQLRLFLREGGLVRNTCGNRPCVYRF